jgi:hypothetical protein
MDYETTYNKAVFTNLDGSILNADQNVTIGVMNLTGQKQSFEFEEFLDAVYPEEYRATDVNLKTLTSEVKTVNNLPNGQSYFFKPCPLDHILKLTDVVAPDTQNSEVEFGYRLRDYIGHQFTITTALGPGGFYMQVNSTKLPKADFTKVLNRSGSIVKAKIYDSSQPIKVDKSTNTVTLPEPVCEHNIVDKTSILIRHPGIHYKITMSQPIDRDEKSSFVVSSVAIDESKYEEGEYSVKIGQIAVFFKNALAIDYGVYDISTRIFYPMDAVYNREI